MSATALPVCDAPAPAAASATPNQPGQRLKGRRIACFYPWTPFESTGAWSRYQCMWRYFMDQGAEVTLCLLGAGEDAKLRNIAVRYRPNFNMVGAVWMLAQKFVQTGARPELKSLSQAEISLLLMYEKGIYTEDEKASRWFEEIVAEHDLITCEYPMLVPTLSDFCRKGRKPLIATAHDALFELHGANPLARDLLKQKEVESLRLADEVVFCTERERKLFETFKIRGSVVLNTGDTISVAPGQYEEAKKAVANALGLKTAHYVLFVGSSHGPNVEAVAEIKAMAKQAPEISFIIAGNCSPKATEGNVFSVGFVEATLLDAVYRGASAIIVPLMRGTGTSVKTYEAFNYGKAVISTTIGARGFSVEHGKELIIVDKLADFPAAIRRVLADPALREQLGQQARRFAEALDYRTQFQPYGEIAERLLGPVNAESSEANSATRSLVLVDNNLANRVGHHYNYALSLRDHCRAAGVGFCSLIKTQAEADVLQELDGFPAFEQGIHDDATHNPYPQEWGSLRNMYDFLGSNDEFALALEAGLQNRAAAGDVVFLPNATTRQILGVALLLKKNPIYRMLRFVLLLRYSVNLASGPINARKLQLAKETAEQYAFSFEKLFLVAPGDTVRLTTDSQELAKEYASLAKRPVEVLPIPHTSNETADAAGSGTPPKNKSKLRVVFMGDARDEKGFELLPAIAKACAQEPWASRVELVFQAYVSSSYHLPMGSTIEEMAKLKTSNLHLINSALSAPAYQSLLASADLVLLPYDALTYRARTSGPFVEAICAGKPVVVPAQSWMATQLGSSGAGRTFTSGNAVDLMNAVLTTLRNYDEHAKAAEALGKTFREFHNPENFVRKLMAK